MRMPHRTSHTVECMIHVNNGRSLKILLMIDDVSSNQSINQYKLYSEINFTENIKIFLQLYMIKTDLLTCHQDLVRGGCY